MTLTTEEALALSAAQLDELFGSSPVGPIPRGRGAGTALAAPATRWSRPFARAAALFWRGKRFEPVQDQLQNLLTRFEFRLFRARVREEPSLVDGRPCIVLDYSKSSPLVRLVRDEIRQVGTGNYLGIVFVAKHRIPLRFWLHFPNGA